MYSKVIPIGTLGSLTISEAAGEAKLVVAVADKTGGSIPGVATATLSAEVDVSAKSLIDVGLALIAAKYPTAAPILTALQAIIDAEVVNL